MTMLRVALLSASVLCAIPAFAQTAVPATPVVPAAIEAAPAAVFVTGNQDNVLRSGTPIALRMMEGLTTKGKKLKVGQRFNMETAEAVEVNGVIVVPAGSPAVGEVTDIRNKGMWGKSGYIQARAISVRANGRLIRLTGSVDDKGVAAGGGAAAASALVFLPAGFFMTGTSAVIPVGAPVNAFIDEDVAFAPGAAPAPMVVPAAVVQPVPQTTAAN